MSRPLTPRLYKLNELINEEVKNIIFEIFDKLIPTEYTVVKDIKYGEFIYDQYVFTTKSNQKYEVDFYHTILNLNKLKNVIEYFPNEKIINCIDIGFTIFNNVDNDYHDYGIEGTLNDPYLKRTNKNEQYEVLGKVAYIVNEYIEKHPEQKIYAIGKNTYKSNLKTYEYMYEKLFKFFIKIEDKSENYNEGAIYFIKNH
jgi:hypothetical protein